MVTEKVLLTQESKEGHTDMARHRFLQSKFVIDKIQSGESMKQISLN